MEKDTLKMLANIKASFEKIVPLYEAQELGPANSNFRNLTISEEYDSYTDETKTVVACGKCGTHNVTIRKGYRWTTNCCTNCGHDLGNTTRSEYEQSSSGMVFFKGDGYDCMAYVRSRRTIGYDSNGVARPTKWVHEFSDCAAVASGEKFIIKNADSAPLKTNARLENVFYARAALWFVDSQLNNHVLGVALDPNGIYSCLKKINEATVKTHKKPAAKPPFVPFTLTNVEYKDVVPVLARIEKTYSIPKEVDVQIWCTECDEIFERQHLPETYYKSSRGYETNGYKTTCPKCGKEIEFKEYLNYRNSLVTLEETADGIDAVVYEVYIDNNNWNLTSTPVNAMRFDKAKGKVSWFSNEGTRTYPRGPLKWKAGGYKNRIYSAKVKALSHTLEHMADGLSELLDDSYYDSATVFTKFVLAYLKNPVIADTVLSGSTQAAAIRNYLNGKIEGSINLDASTPEEMLGSSSAVASWIEDNTAKAAYASSVPNADVSFLEWGFSNGLDTEVIRKLTVLGFTHDEIRKYLDRVNKYQCLPYQQAGLLWAQYLEYSIVNKKQLTEEWEKFPRYLHTAADIEAFNAKKACTTGEEPATLNDVNKFAFERYNYVSPRGNVEIKASTRNECSGPYSYGYRYIEDGSSVYAAVIDKGVVVGGLCLSYSSPTSFSKFAIGARSLPSKYNVHINAYIEGIKKTVA